MTVDLSTETDESFKPSLFDIHNVLEERIVGEHQSRMALFTSWVLSDRHVLMQGPRSSGKSWITDDVANKFLGMRKSFSDDDKGDDSGKCYPVTLGSDKSAWYQVEQINAASHILIYEMQQMPKDFMEVLKKWGEGKEATYKVTQNIGGVRGIKPYVLYPRPFTLCLADEEELKVGEQFMSRVTVIRTDNSIDQTDAVNYRQAQLARDGKYSIDIDDKLLSKLRQHIATLPPFKSLRYIHPVADMFVTVIPSFFTDARRDFPKYLDNTYGVARFYWKERIIGKTKKGDKLLFVTPQDMYLNHLIYGQVAVESSLKCSSMDRTMIEIIRLNKDKIKARDVQKELRKHDMNVSVHMVSRHLVKLSDIGYIERDKTSTTTYYEPGELFDNFSIHVDWKEVIDKCRVFIQDKYSKLYNTYNERYLVKPTVTHPFSGEQINLLEIEDIEPEKEEDQGLAKFQNKEDKDDKEEPTIGTTADEYIPAEEEEVK